MATSFQPPPTYALPILVDEKTGRAQFNPIWLKWFVDMAQVLSSFGGGSGSADHNMLSNLQGGASSQYYHLDAAEYASIASPDGDKGDITVSGGGTVWTIDNGAVTAAKTSISGTPTGSKFLRDDFSWQTPGGGGGGGAWTEVEIDFGTEPVYDATFTITDAAITSSAVKMVLVPCGKAATGRTADDWQWDGGTFVANPGAGSATCYATFYPGPVVGRRTLQYQIG